LPVSTLIDDIELLRVNGDTGVLAKIYLGLDERHLIDHELEWRPPMLQAARAAQVRYTDANGKVDVARFAAELARLRLEDFHWDWRKLNAIFAARSGCSALAIECDGHAQGLMIIDTENHASHLLPKGQPIAYVERLASAPWNRGTFIPKVTFGVTGYALVATAIAISRRSSLDGRVGLHSVSGSVGFYAHKCGMTSLGPDVTKQGLVYLEMSPQQADAFLAKLATPRGAP
jgi:hypothetical protein